MVPEGPRHCRNFGHIPRVQVAVEFHDVVLADENNKSIEKIKS
jgi:hypothetical protein